MTRIQVQLNSSGQTGTVDDSEFDPKIYTKVTAPVANKAIQSSQAPSIPGMTADQIKQAIATSQQHSSNLQAIAQGNSPKTGNVLQDLLSSITDPFIKTGKNVAGAAYEGGRAIAQATGQKNVYTNEQGQTIQNPFLTEEQLQGASQNPLGFLGQQIGNSANIASYGIPFGKGANFLTKALIPGAAVGGIQGATQEGATPVSALEGAATGALTTGGLFGAGKILTKGGGALGDLLSKGASGLLKSQYGKVNGRLSNDIATLSDKYGLKNINDVKNVAQPVIDKVTGIVSRAVGGADAVNMGAVKDAQGAVSSKGIIDTVGNLVDNATSVSETEGNKIKGQINKFINSSSGKDIAGSDPNATHSFIKDMESKANDYFDAFKKGRDIKDRQLGQVYSGIAGELKDRLYQGAGADKELINNTINLGDIQDLNKLVPGLGDELSKGEIKTVGQLRSLIAPFTNTKILLDQAENQSANKTQVAGDVLAGAGGDLIASLLTHGGLTSPVGLAVGAGAYAGKKALETPAGKVGLSNIFNAGANAAGKIGQADVSPILQNILGQTASRTPSLALGVGLNGNNGNNQSGNTDNNQNEGDHVGNVTQSTTDVNSPRRIITLDQLSKAATDQHLKPADYSKLKDIYDAQEKAIKDQTDNKKQQSIQDNKNTVNSLYSLVDSYNKSGPLGLNVNQYADYESQKNLFADALAKSLGVSRSNPSVVRIINNLPNRFSVLDAKGKFSGTLKQVLSKTGSSLKDLGLDDTLGINQ